MDRNANGQLFMEAGDQYIKLSIMLAFLEAILITIGCIIIFLLKYNIIENKLDDSQKNAYLLIGIVCVAIEWGWYLYIVKGKYGKGLAMMSSFGGGPISFIFGFMFYNIISSWIK